MLTTPPPVEPYCAEKVDVLTFISWMVSGENVTVDRPFAIPEEPAPSVRKATELMRPPPMLTPEPGAVGLAAMPGSSAVISPPTPGISITSDNAFRPLSGMSASSWLVTVLPSMLSSACSSGVVALTSTVCFESCGMSVRSIRATVPASSLKGAEVAVLKPVSTRRHLVGLNGKRGHGVVAIAVADRPVLNAGVGSRYDDLGIRRDGLGLIDHLSGDF